MCDTGLNIAQCGLQNLGIVGNGVRDVVGAYAQQVVRAVNLIPQAAVEAPGLFINSLGRTSIPGGLCGGLVGADEPISELNSTRCTLRSERVLKGQGRAIRRVIRSDIAK